MNKIKIGLIGCGLVGVKRINALPSNCKLVACSDVDKKKIKKLKNEHNCQEFSDWKQLIKLSEIEIVIISTPHNLLSTIAIQCLKRLKHVFIEKPGAINQKEFSKIIHAQKKYQKIVYVGYNHRFHPSIIKSKELVKKNLLGDILYIRGRYGHGGRIGYEKEWRANKNISGGGEIIDQGSHLIDLSTFFLGRLKLLSSFPRKYFWKIDVEDNGFIILENIKKNIAFLHASWTEWKNLFSFEIYGQKGKIEISGLGGSYGEETLTLYKMSKKLGPPKKKIWRFNSEIDKSWNLEFKFFYKLIKRNNFDDTNLYDSYQTMQIIEKIYKNKI